VRIDCPKVHESAFARIRGGRVAYAPIGIPLLYDVVLRNGAIVPGPLVAEQDANGKTQIIAAKAEGTPKSRFLEEAHQAELRATRMESIWNLVWWRRIVYFITLFSSFYLVAFPWLTNVLSTRNSISEPTTLLARYMELLITVTRYAVPNWVGETWLGTFGQEPLLFLIGVTCVTVTVLIGSSLEETIRSRAGAIWQANWRTVPKWVENPKSTWLFKLRSNPTVIKAYRHFAWRVLPTIFLAVRSEVRGRLNAIAGGYLALAVAISYPRIRDPHPRHAMSMAASFRLMCSQKAHRRTRFCEFSSDTMAKSHA
jgi:hypothetical protein